MDTAVAEGCPLEPSADTLSLAAFPGHLLEAVLQCLDA
jgi:hypothetical protein